MKNNNKILFKEVVKPNIKLYCGISLIIGVLVGIMSLIGILNPHSIYREEQRIDNLATDWTNLVIILPILFLSVFYVFKDKLMALLLWPSTLLYFVFIYLFYSIAVPFNWTFLPYLVICSGSGYTFILLFRRIHAEKIKNHYLEHIPRKTIGGILLIFGFGFLVIDLLDFFQTLQHSESIEIITYVPWIVDFTVGIPILLITGFWILQKDPMGYMISPSLLLYVGLLDLGVTILYIFKLIYQEPDFEWIALITFLIISVVCFYPLRFFFNKPNPELES